MPQVRVGPLLFDAANDEHFLPAPSGPAVYQVQLVGTSTQTIEFQDSQDDGTTFVARRLTNLNSGTAVANLTAAGLFAVGEPGSDYVVSARLPKLRNTAFTSGSFNAWVTITS